LEEFKGGDIVVVMVVEERVALSGFFLRCVVDMKIKLVAVRAGSRDLIPGRRIDCRIFHTARPGSGSIRYPVK
jgi:hypothetical protein